MMPRASPDPHASRTKLVDRRAGLSNNKADGTACAIYRATPRDVFGRSLGCSLATFLFLFVAIPDLGMVPPECGHEHDDRRGKLHELNLPPHASHGYAAIL